MFSGIRKFRNFTVLHCLVHWFLPAPLKPRDLTFKFLIVIRIKKINKCFSGHFFEKRMWQAGFYFYFFILKKTTDEAFYIFI